MPSTKQATKRLAKSSITRFRQQLETRRQEILNLYEHDLEVGKGSEDIEADDLVDRANDAYNREFMLSFSGGERERLREIEAALERLDDGSYGFCQPCGINIPQVRLKAVPWARYCIDCQERDEQGLLVDVD